MLRRMVALREEGRIGLPRGVGVLVKAPKQRQDRRFDLPSIGPDTVLHAARRGSRASPSSPAAPSSPSRSASSRPPTSNGLFVVGRADREAG